MLTYEGLTATYDHKVFAQDESGATKIMRFDDAAIGGAHLIQSGSGGYSVRVGDDHLTRETLQRDVESCRRFNRVSGLRTPALDQLREFASRVVQRMQTVCFKDSLPILVESKTDSRKTAVLQSPGSAVLPLRRKRSDVRLPFRSRCLSVGNEQLRYSGPISEIGARPNEQRTRLCSGESSLGYQERECGKPFNHLFERVGSAILALFGVYGETQAGTGEISGSDYTRGASRSEREAQVLAYDSGEIEVYDLLNAGPRHRYTVSDHLVHNCSYGGSIGAMRVMGAEGADEEIYRQVNIWRTSNPHIVAFWSQLEEAFIHGGFVGDKIEVERGGSDRLVWLPSGRCVVYHNVGTDEWLTHVIKNPDTGKMVREKYNAKIAFDSPRGHDMRIGSWGGKLTENVTQAVARDLLANSMYNIQSQGYDVVGHIHDEALVDVSGIPMTDRASAAKTIGHLMRTPPAWAEGFPLDADGWYDYRYKKD